MNISDQKSGFSLVELMVAVLILGILSAVAIPHYMSHVQNTYDQEHKIKLMLLRDAIERYITDNDRELPPATNESDFKLALTDYFNSDFPGISLPFDSRPVGFDASGVAIVNTGTLSGDLSPTKGWKYDATTGQIIINLKVKTALDPSVTYDQW